MIFNRLAEIPNVALLVPPIVQNYFFHGIVEYTNGKTLYHVEVSYSLSYTYFFGIMCSTINKNKILCTVITTDITPILTPTADVASS